MVWKRTDATSDDRVGGIYIPASGSRANHGRYSGPLSPLVDLQRQGIANLLARQQEEHEEYLVEKTLSETPRYLVRLRAARQAAQNAISSTRDDLKPQCSYCSRIRIAVAIAFSILLFLKLRYG